MDCDIVNETVDQTQYKRRGLQSLHFVLTKQVLLPLTFN